jgi:hypothetical protein
MGEEGGGAIGVAELGASESPSPAAEGTGPPVATDSGAMRSALAVGRRRFVVAATTAMALMAVPFLWILWSLWGPVNVLRPTVYENNFYDLQARAMFHGHLSLAPGSLGIEGFVHDGRTYTYFGLFPSIVRMPVLLVTSSLDAKLTPTYMLLAWLLTGLFTSLLLWRVRFLVRGDVVMGRMEAAAFGGLVATIMGGTVWMLLASTPYVFNEDIAWSICLTIGSIFALLGVVERPTWPRVVCSGLLILCANLDRATTGWACVVAAVFIAGWFALGFGGAANRRWCLPLLAAGLIPLVVSCLVNYAKFGALFGVSNELQVWTHVNAYRRKFLAANHGAEEGLVFVPTNALAYLRPDGLRFTSVFPFITLPAAPPRAVGGVLFDRLYRTASLPSSTPLLFLLSCWGLVTAFRPRSVGRVAYTRLLLLAAGSAGAALLLWGYIAPRYLGDFVPFLALASAVAMADIWRRLEGRRESVRVGALVVIGLVALFSIVANIGMAVVPNEEWSTAQTLGFVKAQSTISDSTGNPLKANVVRGATLPPWGPAGQLYVVGDCDGLYISNGEDYSTVPSQQFTRTTWMTVELGHSFQHVFAVTAEPPATGGSASASLVTVGKDTVAVSATATGNPHLVRLIVGFYGQGKPIYGHPVDVVSGTSQNVVVITDPAKHQVEATVEGVTRLSTTLGAGVPVRISSDVSPARSTRAALSVVDVTASSAEPLLCRNLIR